MKHYIDNDDTKERVIFETFDAPKMLEVIKRMLVETPDTMVVHRKEHLDKKKYYGDEIINFYENHKNEPCLVVTKNNKNYFKTI